MQKNLLAAVVLAVAIPLFASAQDVSPVPEVAYQGRLLESGAPVTGTRTFTFAILDAKGIELWNSGAQGVEVNAGLYAVILGAPPMPVIPETVLGRAYLSLRVKIGSTVLTPDVAMIPSMQARSAWELTGAFDGDVQGTQLATVVMSLQGKTLDLLSTPPSTGQAIVYNGTKWVPGTVAGTPGPTGPQGPAGATGTAGATGPAGTPGAQGVPGLQGAAGPAGAEGPVGPQGSVGPSGPQGSTGAAGQTVIAGKAVLNGAGDPTAGIGIDGDFYINTTTNILFGPKDAGAWPEVGVSMIGPAGVQGVQGIAGAQGAQGTTGPAGAQGPAGSDGATGAQGPQGLTGEAGQTVIAGKAVLNGSANPASGVGIDGDFYINTSTNILFGPKAAGAWPVVGVSMIGPPGPQGLQGVAGALGPAGPQGPGGTAGTAGATGDTGPQGIQGVQGAQGISGVDGQTIVAGKAVLYGAADPISEVGIDGDFYVNTSTNVFFGPKASGAWPVVGVSMIGPAGPQGIQGVAGAQGSAGSAGGTGPAGARGPAGADGAIGAQGPQGPQGPTGEAGTNGSQGPQGVQGTQGVAGVDGQTIVAGKAVLYGSADPAASTGADGDFYINTSTNVFFGPKASGAWPVVGVSMIGPSGPQGIQGVAGPAGTAGAAGPQGQQGVKGDPGSGSGTVTAVTATAPLSSSGGSAPNISLDTVPVASGGTGATSLTANNVLLGNGTSAVQAVAPGTTGNVLTSNGTTWTSAASSGGLPPLPGNNYRYLETDGTTAQWMESLMGPGTGNTKGGQGALNSWTSGVNNTVIGYSSGRGLTTGMSNTAIGYQSMSGNTAARSVNNVAVGDNTLIGGGILNTAVGSNSLRALNVITAEGNTAVGAYSAATLTSGKYNVFLGAITGPLNVTAGTYSNQIAIGYGARTSAPNQMVLGGDGRSGDYPALTEIIPGKNNSASLGSTTNAWTGLYLAGSSSGYIALQAAYAPSSYTFTLPANAGTAGYVLSTNGSGTTSWIAAGGGGGGTVTNVTGTSPISVATGTTTPVISLGTVPVASGGTGATTLTGYVKGSGTSAMTASASIPVADVTGAAPLASPTFTGTVTAPGFSGPLTGNVVGNATTATTAAGLSATLAVTSGGTGTATAPSAAGGVIYAASTSAFGATGAGTSGQLLTSAGTGTPTWTSVGTAANNIVQLDGSAKLPAVDGSQLTGVVATVGSFATRNTSGGTSTNVGGSDNTAFGYQALKDNTGNGSSAFGSLALSTATGGGNSAFGVGALRSTTTGFANVAVGDNAGFTLAFSYGNVAVGSSALYTATTGANENTAIGASAFYNLTTGASSVAVGYKAGALVTTGTYNTPERSPHFVRASC